MEWKDGGTVGRKVVGIWDVRSIREGLAVGCCDRGINKVVSVVDSVNQDSRCRSLDSRCLCLAVLVRQSPYKRTRCSRYEFYHENVHLERARAVDSSAASLFSVLSALSNLDRPHRLRLLLTNLRSARGILTGVVLEYDTGDIQILHFEMLLENLCHLGGYDLGDVVPLSRSPCRLCFGRMWHVCAQFNVLVLKLTMMFAWATKMND